MDEICVRCGHQIRRGQSYIRFITAYLHHSAVRHVACPTERQVRQAKLWGRWQ